MLATPYMALATGAYLFLVAGVRVRRSNPKLHAALMSLAIVADLSLVLVLQLSRGAVQEAAGLTMTWPQMAHVTASTVATALYIPVFALGLQLLRGAGGQGRRQWHIRLAVAAFVFRTIGFAFMFSLLSHVGR